MIAAAILLFAAQVQAAPAQTAQAEAQPDPTAQALISCAPQTYDAAITCLDRHLSADSKEALRRDGAVMAHFGLGMWMRNNWGLWRGGPLAAAMRARGVRHPDDMSGAILDGFVERLRAANPSAPVQPMQGQN